MSFSIEGLGDDCIAALNNELSSVYAQIRSPQRCSTRQNTLENIKDDPEFYEYLALSLKICKNLGIDPDTINSAKKIIEKVKGVPISLEKLLTLATKGLYPTIIINKRDKDLNGEIFNLYEEVSKNQQKNF